MALARTCPGWRARANLVSPLTSALCLFLPVAAFNRQFPTAKITNSSSPFRRVIECAWKNCGARNFQNSRSLASENSIGNQQSAISNCPAAMFISASAAETEAAGAHLAGTIQPGDVLALVGDLGAGKTQFVKGLAKGLGSTEVVTSPTFTPCQNIREADCRSIISIVIELKVWQRCGRLVSTKLFLATG